MKSSKPRADIDHFNTHDGNARARSCTAVSERAKRASVRISCWGLPESGARRRRARAQVAYEARDSGGGAIGLRVTLGGAMTVIAASVGGAAGASCKFQMCGEGAWQEPQPQSKVLAEEAALTAGVAVLDPPSAAWLIAI